MVFNISQTIPGTIRYPLHTHDFWEILYYLEGTGYLATNGPNLPYKPGTILMIPPGLPHGSVSDSGFRNISIGGSFEHLFLFQTHYSFTDNPEQEGKMLAEAILRNRFGNPDYINSLCTSFVQFLLQNIHFDTEAAQVIRGIVRQIEERFTDPETDVTVFLRESGYSEDYIRSKFRQFTGKTPIELLHQLRINYAKNILDIYGKDLTIGQVSAQCGFSDPVYFSKKFKSLVGVSPADYKRNHKI